MGQTISVRIADSTDADAIEVIEKECFVHPWSADDIRQSMNYSTVFAVADFNTEIMGYCGIQCVCGEGYITNVAVRKAYRRKGAASLLLGKIKEIARQNKLQFVSLEVRESNLGAIELYKENGFTVVGKRPRFYTAPTEDALLMTYRLEYEE